MNRLQASSVLSAYKRRWRRVYTPRGIQSRIFSLDFFKFVDYSC